MLSFGGLLAEVIQAGSGGISSSNPGLVKVLGGFVFPIGLVMYVSCLSRFIIRVTEGDLCVRIVLQGQELLTSNMMVCSSP